MRADTSLLLGLALASAACGDSDPGSGPADARIVANPADAGPLDLNGPWNLVETTHSSDCPELGEVTRQVAVRIEHSGDAFTVIRMEENTELRYAGTLAGSAFTWTMSASYTRVGGCRVAVHTAMAAGTAIGGRITGKDRVHTELGQGCGMFSGDVCNYENDVLLTAAVNKPSAPYTLPDSAAASVGCDGR